MSHKMGVINNLGETFMKVFILSCVLGAIVFEGRATAQTVVENEDGSVTLSGTVANLNLQTYNDRTKIIIDGLTGHLSSSNQTVTAPVEIATGGFTINNGYSNKTYTFTGALTGEGSFIVSGTPTLGFKFHGDCSAFTGTFDFSGGDNTTLYFGDGTAAVTPASPAGTGGIKMDASRFAVFNYANDVTIPNVISGSGGVQMDGAGVLTLSGVNTFDGNVVINSGSVRITHAQGIGGSNGSNGPDLLLKSGTMDLAFTSSTGAYGGGVSNWLHRGGDISLGGVAGGTTTLAASGIISSNPVGFGVGPGFGTTLSYDATNNGGTATISAYWGGIGSSSSQNVPVAVGDSSATDVELDFTGRISNTGQIDGQEATLEKTGAGTLRISAANYLPGLTVSEGTLIVNHAQALGTNRVLEHLVTNNANIELNGFEVTVGGLAGQGTFTNSSSELAVLTIGDTNNQDATFNGVIADGSGAVALVKAGTGTLTLSGENTFSGGINLVGGVVELGHTSALGTGLIQLDLANEGLAAPGLIQTTVVPELLKFQFTDASDVTALEAGATVQLLTAGSLPPTSTFEFYDPAGALLGFDGEYDPETGNYTFSVNSPVLGLQIDLNGSVLTWSAEQEVGVASYEVQQLIGGVWTTAEVLSAGAEHYETLINPAYAVRLVVVDYSGFKQTFLPDLAGKAHHSYVLNAGWNLLSMPFADADLTNLRAVVDGEPMVWNGRSYEVIAELKPGMAFFIYASASAEATISGTRTVVPLILGKGWNLVGVTENQLVPEVVEIIYTLDSSYQEIAADHHLIEGVGYWIFKK